VLLPHFAQTQMNHRADFKDDGNLVQILFNAWQIMIQKLPRYVSTKVLIFEAGGAEDIMKQVSSWNKSKDPSKCEECLKELLRTKSNLAKSKKNQAWPILYLSKFPIQQYLKWVVKVMQGKNSKHIKPLMQQLLEPSDVDAVKNFPDKDFIFKWLNQSNQHPE